jgi:hypothetical protein
VTAAELPHRPDWLTESEWIGRLAAAEMTVTSAPHLAVRSLARYQAEVEHLRARLGIDSQHNPVES